MHSPRRWGDGGEWSDGHVGKPRACVGPWWAKTHDA